MPRARRHAAANETESTDVIVISGVLLLVAVVFLVIGLFGSLAWVYASIGVSVASFVFLLLGVRQRRGAAPDMVPISDGLSRLGPVGGSASADPADEVTVVPPPAAPEGAPGALAGTARGGRLRPHWRAPPPVLRWARARRLAPMPPRRFAGARHRRSERPRTRPPPS